MAEAQHASVGAALLWTLRQGLGEAATPAVIAAWASAYRLLSGVRIAAANEPLGRDRLITARDATP